MKISAVLSLLVLAPAGFLCAASDTQTITLDHKLQIPGATLKSGEYTFEVEDRLQDRAIIRITDSKKKTHELLLAVPNEKLNQAEHGKLIFFPNGNSDKQILEGWMCSSCQSALQVVYPKAEAVKITGVSAKPVLAVDPTYDKLPKNLSQDDMKVVTLWLLSPKEVTAEQKGKGIEAAKWADVSVPKTTEMVEAKVASPAPEASAPGVSVAPSAPEAPAPTPVATTPAAPVVQAAPVAQAPVQAAPVAQAPVQVASSSQPEPTSDQVAPVSHRRMPHTASNTFNFGLIGLALLAAGFGLRLQRRLHGVSPIR